MIFTNLYLQKVNSSCFCFIFSPEYMQENTEENEEFKKKNVRYLKMRIKNLSGIL